MNNKFDELTKCMAQLTTRRAALRKFGSSLAGVALAFVGMVNKAEARPKTPTCDCSGLVPFGGCDPKDRKCIAYCEYVCS